MKKPSYARLKLKMLLWVAGGALLGTIFCLCIAALLRSTSLGDPLLVLCRGVGRLFFGKTGGEVDRFLQEVVLPNRQLLFMLVLLPAMLVAFYVAMGRFTRRFAQIGAAVHGMMDDPASPVSLSRELEPLEADLNAMGRELAQREEEAHQAAQRSRDLVVFLAHDLKTPLTSVIGYLNLMVDQPHLPADQRAKYAGIALEKARRLEELISEFFDINRLELDQIDRTEELVDLSILLEQVADEFWPIFEERGLVFLPTIGPGLKVKGEGDKLARVFDNVLRNAANYSVPGGSVGLRAFRQGPGIVISVSNEGLEIPEQELTQIFEKFYRLDVARSTRTGGAGLGLAIAKEIVERHGGSIRAESTGKRVTFTITLPGR